MTNALAHRGPDGDGVWLGPAGVALGHRRLSIIDLSESGKQPMHSASGRYTISFNGEVFNFEELRHELEREGKAPPWRGHSDTEVMLAAFDAWGLRDAIDRFVGMFAFALWDVKERRLHLVRDRLGIKPLYYATTPFGLCFGSELKSLRLFPGFKTEIDRTAVAEYFRVNCVPAPRTIYRGARKVLPGTVVSFTAPTDSGRSESRFWSGLEVARRGLENPFRGDDAEAVEALELELRRAVRLRMVSDVPIGVFLSGGVDSSTVAALMQRESSRPINSFSIANEASGFDESKNAAAIAAHLGTNHVTLTATPSAGLDVIPLLPAMYDEPFSDSSQIPTYLVAKLARPHVTVALSGDGGDELFGGYNRHVWAPHVWNGIRWFPTQARRALARGITSVSPDRWERAFSAAGPLAARIRVPGIRMHKLAGLLSAHTPDDMYTMLTSHWMPSDGLLVDEVSDPAPPPTIANADFAEQMMLRDMLGYLPDDILTKVDRASMAVSLEARVPLLDHRLVEFAWTLPRRLKVGGLTGKRILRSVLHRYVPERLVSGPKTGFGIPLGDWLRGPLRAWAEDLLAPDRLRRQGFLREDVVRTRWDEHLGGRRPWEHHLWDVLIFQSWLEANPA